MSFTEKLARLGLSEQKIKETQKNEALTNVLTTIVDQVPKNSDINKNVGNLLYFLGTKLSKQFHVQIPFLAAYVVNGSINQEAKLTAAIKFVQDHVSGNIDVNNFETFCGVGVEVTSDQIESAVTSAFKKHEASILSMRYQFNMGPLMTDVRQELKWADSRKIKEEFDLQLITILGPKRDEDLLKNKSKGKTSQVSNNISVQTTVPLVSSEKQQLTMTEFLKTVQFHLPGKNYKGDGYVITPETHKLLQEHLKRTGGKVCTRFPPEPNGILHIGHAKAININFGYAAAHNGVCFLRYDDTNPEKEEEKFFLGIRDMVNWLGYEPFKVTHSSDYFDQLYEWAKKLISDNLAFVCHQKPEDVRGRDPPPSPWRERPVGESLQLFEDMKNGKFDEGEATLRLKLTLEEGKVDPIAYRIRYVAHHRTGNKWCIYPTYDYTHCLCDSIEDITHSLCTKEFQSRRSSYYWLCNALNIYCPVQWEYGRLNVQYTVVSKRKIAKLIEEGHVRDWDDPRLFTLTALRRRGFPSEAINNFCATLGLTGAQISIHPDALEASVRDVLNTTASRAMVVLEPLKLVVSNFPFQEAQRLRVPNFPGNEERGFHEVIFDQEIYIERSDFRDVEEKGYRRLTPNQPVGLKHCGYVLTLEQVVNKSNGEIDHLIVHCQPANETNKPKAFVHWVSQGVPCEIRQYERLFRHENPEDPAIVPGGFLDDVNPNSLFVISGLTDISVLDCQVWDKLQFERVGFFSVDPDSKPGQLVFNKTVALKEDRLKN